MKNAATVPAASQYGAVAAVNGGKKATRPQVSETSGYEPVRRAVAVSVGMVNYPTEWWHSSYGD